MEATTRQPSSTAVAALDPAALVAQLGGEVAGTLSAALERVTTLAATGRIDRAGLRALRDEIDRARRAGIMAQQLVRLAGVPLARERVDLTALAREALRQRGRELEARGIEVRQQFEPAQVRSDATLAFSLLQAVLDWSFEHAVSRIDISVGLASAWPQRARLVVGFADQPPDEVDTAATPLDDGEQPALDTMSWRLVQQTARVLGLQARRTDTPGRTKLELAFPDTLPPILMGGFEPDGAGTARTAPGGLVAVDGAVARDAVTTPAHELERETDTVGPNSQPLAGHHVLVIAARREVRNVVRQALRPMGLLVDHAASIDEAR
jgi:hypothetical protein